MIVATKKADWEYLRSIAGFTANPEASHSLLTQAFTLDGRLCASNGVVLIWSESDIVIPPFRPVPKGILDLIKRAESLDFESAEHEHRFKPCHCGKCECDVFIFGNNYPGVAIQRIQQESAILGFAPLKTGFIDKTNTDDLAEFCATALALELEIGFAVIAPIVASTNGVAQ